MTLPDDVPYGAKERLWRSISPYDWVKVDGADPEVALQERISDFNLIEGTHVCVYVCVCVCHDWGLSEDAMWL